MGVAPVEPGTATTARTARSTRTRVSAQQQAADHLADRARLAEAHEHRAHRMRGQQQGREGHQDMGDISRLQRHLRSFAPAGRGPHPASRRSYGRRAARASPVLGAIAPRRASPGPPVRWPREGGGREGGGGGREGGEGGGGGGRGERRGGGTSRMRARGLEPPRPRPPAPKAGASTSSATPARIASILRPRGGRSSAGGSPWLWSRRSWVQVPPVTLSTQIPGRGGRYDASAVLRYAPVAQGIEQQTSNLPVVRSNRTGRVAARRLVEAKSLPESALRIAPRVDGVGRCQTGCRIQTLGSQ